MNSNIKSIRLIVIVWILFKSQVLYSSNTIYIKNDINEFSVTRSYIDFLIDKTNSFDIHTISMLDKHSFEASTAKDLVNDDENSTYWLRFEVSNPTTNPKNYIVEMFDYDIDELSLFYPNKDGTFKELKAGYTLPFSIRSIPHKNMSFMLEKCNEPVTIYMKIKSRRLNVLEPMIRSYDYFMSYSLTEYIMFGVFYGVFIFMILYNSLYFIILKRKYYLFFVFYAGAALLQFLSKNGIGYQYLWPDSPWYNKYIDSTGFFLATIAMMVLFVDFFEINKTEKVLFHTICTLMIFRIGYFVIQIITPSFEYHEFIDVLYVQIFFFFSILLYRNGNQTTRWFIVAYSILNVTFFIKLLEQANLIGSNVFTVYSINIGVAIQFILISIGIAESVRKIYLEKNEAQANLIIQFKQNEILKEKVNKELENKVKERTKELEFAKGELEKKAEENLKMNVALDLANNQLKKYLNSFAKDVVMNTHMDFHSFSEAYPDDLSCMRYLYELKLKSGFCCKKCGNDKSIKGKNKFDVRCSKCNYNESLTSHTIFHKCKFSLQKAFYMLYLISQTKDDIPSSELSKTLTLQMITCQNFKKKVIERIKMNTKKNGKSVGKHWEYLILDQEVTIKD